jgi:ankyrin repeat protein
VQTPLEAAAADRNQRHVAFFLKNGADINLGIRMTPLEAATSERWAEDVIRLLLDHGADANGGIIRTPLEALLCHWGTEAFDLAQLLIEKGADVNRGIKTAPLQVAKSYGYSKIAQLLLERGAVVNEEGVMIPSAKRG